MSDYKFVLVRVYNDMSRRDGLIVEADGTRAELRKLAVRGLHAVIAVHSSVCVGDVITPVASSFIYLIQTGRII